MATKKKTNTKLGWHFLPASRTLEYGDGRKVVVGQTLSIPSYDTPSCCHKGMHASVRPSDAATYNRGPVLCRVEVSGDIDTEHDKFCGRNRKVLWMKEMTAKDVEGILKAAGETYDPYSGNFMRQLGRHGENAKLDKAIENWANKNGLGGTVTPVVIVPVVTVKDVLPLLSKRYVRTTTELETALKDAGFDMSTWDDVVDELSYEDKVHQISDFEKKSKRSYDYVDGWLSM